MHCGGHAGVLAALIRSHSGALAASACLRDSLGAFCAFSAQAAFAEQPQPPADLAASYARSSAISGSSPARRAGRRYTDAVLEHLRQQWQQVAGLSAQQARQLHERHQVLLEASLRAALLPSSCLGFHASNLQENAAILRDAGLCSSWDELHACSPELRGLLALTRPALLQQVLHSQGMQQQLLQQPLPPAGPAAGQLETPMLYLQQLLASAFVRHQPQHHPQQQQLHHHHSGNQQQQQQATTGLQLLQQLERHQELAQVLEHLRQRKAADPAKALAASLLQLLGIGSDHQLPLNALPHDLRAEITRQPRRTSSSGSSSPASSSSSSSSAWDATSQPDQRRLMSTASLAASRAQRQQAAQAALRSEDALAAALARVERSSSFRGKAKLPRADMQALLAQLQQQATLGPPDVLALLLRRPAVLYQHCMQQLPGAMLGLLQQQVPDLDIGQALAAAPALLSVPAQQVSEVLQLLLGRLQLPRPAAAQLLAAHPRLLAQPAKASALNLGFLVGIGLTPADLAAMLQQQPAWLTRPLGELTQQCQYLQHVAKVSWHDVVLYPDLLSLPIHTCIGPRLDYAAKHKINLLLPSQAALLGELPRSEWQRQRIVPLQHWLGSREQQMCSSMGLQLSEYRSYKACWMQVHAPSGSKASKGR